MHLPFAPGRTGHSASSLLGALLLAAPLLFAAASADAFQPVFEPALTVSRAAGDIQIDGRLGDPGWTDAARADGFAEVSPGENIEPLVETEAYV
ncbi:MAG: hypothetical protein FJY75_08035, partial [Candidatus Eisenbacteria bacterium]|nr:hypothetical protein [Candidatus Eisenbacteria bacterium]